jgi:hypothetical protein
VRKSGIDMIYSVEEAIAYLNVKGYVCIPVSKDASWMAEYIKEIDAVGVAVETDAEAAHEVAGQITDIKKQYREEEQDL